MALHEPSSTSSSASPAFLVLVRTPVVADDGGLAVVVLLVLGAQEALVHILVAVLGLGLADRGAVIVLAYLKMH